MKTALCLTTAVFRLAILSVSPATVQADDYTYVTNNGTITITRYTPGGGVTGGDVTIPGEINGLPVTAIGGFSFYCYAHLNSVTIPNSVTTIGDSAFADCTSLTSISMPNGVTTIGGYAFEHCSLLTSFTIPDSVTSIGDGALSYCSRLPSVIIPGSVTSIGVDAFRGCFRLTALSAVMAARSLDLPGGWRSSDRSRSAASESEVFISSFASGFMANLPRELLPPSDVVVRTYLPALSLARRAFCPAAMPARPAALIGVRLEKGKALFPEENGNGVRLL